MTIMPASSAQTALRVIICFSFDHRAPVQEIRAFKQCLIDCPSVLHSIELSGTFDFIIEAGLPDLHAYHQKLEAISVPLQKLVLRYEASFVCKRFPKPNPGTRDKRYEECFWVPRDYGFARIEVQDVDKITAERDYSRLHVGDRSYLLHCTMSSLLEKLDPTQFVHLHRSAIVRRDFVDGFLHQRRQWIARLADGTFQNVSKSHAGEVMGMVHRSSPQDANSSMQELVIEKSGPLVDHRVQAAI